MALYARPLENQEGQVLQAIQKAKSMPVQLVQRAQIIMRSAVGQQAADIASEVGLSVSRVRVWIKRFNREGLLGLFDRPRSGRPREYTAKQALQVVAIATEKPAKLGVSIGT